MSDNPLGQCLDALAEYSKRVRDMNGPPPPGGRNIPKPGGFIIGHGSVVKEYKSLKPKKAMCSGCRENFYNGHNSLGVSECWHFKSARVVDKAGHSSIHVMYGPDVLKKKTLSCWCGQS